jgi:hypothetical protein
LWNSFVKHALIPDWASLPAESRPIRLKNFGGHAALLCPFFGKSVGTPCASGNDDLEFVSRVQRV